MKRPSHKFYKVWYSMIRRCTDPYHQSYKYYIDKGIKVCPEWLNYENFIEDMFCLWLPELTLDRIDNDRGYYKDNCRFVTQRENNRNRSYCKMNMESANKLRDDYKSGGFSQSYLANLYGISPSMVSNIVLGRAWV